MSNSSAGWIGVDLDGTLAVYDGWRGPLHIGEPVPKMVDRVKNWLKAGANVRIFTARVSPNSLLSNGVSSKAVVGAIHKWCVANIGKALPVTCEKDFQMVELWDDRCVQIVPNTGERTDGLE